MSSQIQHMVNTLLSMFITTIYTQMNMRNLDKEEERKQLLMDNSCLLDNSVQMYDDKYHKLLFKQLVSFYIS